MNPFEQMTNMANRDRNRGVVTARVVDNVDPDSMGRVQIQFHWLNDGEQSFWARVATPMAGNEMGIYFLPEIDDEVLVAFEHGNIEYPIVIGSLWNGSALPSQENSNGENNIRQIKSRSGHELTFDDTEDGKKLTLQSSGSHKIEFDDSDNSITIESSRGNTVVMDDDGITIEDSGGNSMKMEASGNMTIKCNGDLNLEGTNITIKAGATLKLESNAGTELTSSAITKVQGSLVQIN